MLTPLSVNDASLTAESDDTRRQTWQFPHSSSSKAEQKINVQTPSILSVTAAPKRTKTHSVHTLGQGVGWQLENQQTCKLSLRCGHSSPSQQSRRHLTHLGVPGSFAYPTHTAATSCLRDSQGTSKAGQGQSPAHFSGSLDFLIKKFLQNCARKQPTKTLKNLTRKAKKM